MSISLDTIEQREGSPTAQAITALKGQDNPFECLARPQRADEDFSVLHVPELHNSERAQLVETINWYRLDDYNESDNLKPTRVVTVRGDRGSGKTHMLLSLLARPDGRPQVFVRPAFFEANLEPEEYLLGRLKEALLQEDEFHADRPLDVMARALTRRLLRQALLAAGPTDRLWLLVPSGRTPLRLLWGGGEPLLRRIDHLIRALDEAKSAQDLAAFVAGHGLSAETAYGLVEGHLRTHEVGADPLPAIRRSLYGAMARCALLGDREALPHFLAQGYHDAVSSDSCLRSDLVAELLHALVEACALLRLPIVFAFDNLERLLNPPQQFNGDVTRAFLNTLAQAVDNTRGILFLVFAEAGLFAEQVVPHMDEFARARLEQGVPLAGRGPTYLLDLKEPTEEDIRCLVRARVRPLLAELPEAEQLPEEFPFSSKFLSDLMGTGGANLRNVLIGLRDEYNRLIYETPPDGEKKGINDKKPEPDWPQLLESAWSRSLSAARRRFQDAFSHQDLNAALGAMLQSSLPLTVGDWSLGKVVPTVPVGENPEYGVVTLLDWKVRDGADLIRGPQSLRVAVGFLLVGGTGMAPDLRAKFDFLRERERGVRLVVLWPTHREGEDPIEMLPAGTRRVWDDEAENHWRTELRRIDDLCLRRILAFLELLDHVAEMAGSSVPPEPVRGFLHSRMSKLFPLLLPPAARTPERMVADED